MMALTPNHHCPRERSQRCDTALASLWLLPHVCNRHDMSVETDAEDWSVHHQAKARASERPRTI